MRAHRRRYAGLLLSWGMLGTAGLPIAARADAPTTTAAAPVAAGSIAGRLTLADGGAPRRAVVYLEGGATAVAAPREHARISQRGARFSPDFLVITVGQTVDMPNDDRIVHNVFSVSPAKKFDLGHYGQGESRAVRFEKPGIIELYCNIHENMQAVIVVAPSPSWALVRPDGTFTLAAVPPGAYQLVGYSPDAGSALVRQAVEVKPGEAAAASLTLKGR